MARVTSSISRIAERLRSRNFLIEWRRQPERELAEAMIRLRRARGISQAELANRMGTKQPAIARLESALGNPRLSTVVAVAEGLNAVIRLDLSPVEDLAEGASGRWWESSAHQHAGSQTTFNQVNIQFNTSVVFNAVSNRLEDWSGTAQMQSLLLEPEQLMTDASVDVGELLEKLERVTSEKMKAGHNG